MTDKLTNKEKRAIFADNYEKYYPLVFNILYSKIQSDHEADDLSQEIFIKYYNKLEEVESPRKWLLGVLRHEVFNYYRKNKKSQVDVDDVLNDVNLQFVNGMRDTRIIIEEAINNVDMTEQERLVFEYLTFYNYTQVNTAKILGITRRKAMYVYEKTVKKILGSLSKKGISNIEDLL